MIQVEHFKWIHINRFSASEDASIKKAQGNTNKVTYGKKANEKERANKTARVKWGRGKREANGK